MYESLAVVGIFAFIYSNIAGRVEKSMLSGPIIFVAFGLLMGPLGFGLLDMDVDNVELRTIVDLTLALILFIDAANADLVILNRHFKLPGRMLLIGMPGVLALGVLFGWLLFPDVTVFELCVLATILAATDAALGKAVITNPSVPARLREGLNAESGLNDGLAVPILFVFLALATGATSDTDSTSMALELVVRELGIGIVVGLGLTFSGGMLVNWAYNKGWITEIWKQVLVISLAFACFALAQSLHGSGYIAAFVGGLLFGYLAGKDTHELVHAAEGVGELLALTTWVMFGAAVIGQVLVDLTWPVILYSVLSLTVIRMLPMLVSLAGVDEPMEHKLFLSWFGPRGLASIVFVVIVAGYNLPSLQTIMQVVVCTVTLCVLFHGFSAYPWAQRLGRQQQSAIDTPAD